MGGPFVVMAGSTTILVIAAVVIAVAIYQIRENILEKKATLAKLHILEKTKGYYFYGYPLVECLQANVAWELYWRKIGDFSERLGAIMLRVLVGDSDGDTEPVMHCRRQVEPDGASDHCEALIYFYYEGKWWQLDLSRGLSDRNLRPVHKGRIDNEIAEGFEAFGYWNLKKDQRYLVDNCTSPDRSYLMPDINYTDLERGAKYVQLVRHEVGEIIDWWHSCHEEAESESDYYYLEVGD